MSDVKPLPGSEPSPAWQNAVKSFLAQVPNAERQRFQAPASADECLDLLVMTQRRKSKLTRILGLIKPAIDPLRRFEGAIDVIVQVNAGIASPIWGPLRIVITLAADHFKTLESIAMIIHRVISSLQRISKYEALFKSHQLVQDAIGALYCDYLDFCVRITKFYSSSALRNFFGSFEKDFQDVSKSIQIHSQGVDWAAQAAHIEETQREMELAKAERAAHEAGNVQRWLSPSTAIDDLQGHIKQLMPGSCDWILESAPMEILTTTSTVVANKTVGIHGLPGYGKTMLAAFVINHLSLQDETVLYFFFKAGDVEKGSLLSCIRTILSQLLRTDDQLYKIIEPAYQQSGQAIANSVTEMKTIFSKVIRKIGRRRVILVLDALDESTEPQEVLSWIAAQTDDPLSNLHILYTSRPLAAESLLEKPWLITNIDLRRQDSVQDYIKSRLVAIPALRQNPIITREIVQAVSKASDGIWLYATLMVDELERLPSIGKMQAQLNVLPRGFAELYSQMLTTMEGSLSPLEVKFAQQLHLWIDLADYLPKWMVSAEECLQFHTLSLVFQYANDGEAVFDPIELARRLSGPLLRIQTLDATESSSTTKSKVQTTYEIDFIHNTAQQYLKEANSMSAASLSQVVRPRRHRKLHRAAVAVWYFTKCQDFEAMLNALKTRQNLQLLNNAYFDMAYALWQALWMDSLPEVVDPLETAEITTFLNQIVEFISTDDCLNWIEQAVIINYTWRWPHLLWNTLDVYKAAKAGTEHPFKPFADFSKARLRWSRMYATVLATTGPSSEIPVQLIHESQKDVAHGGLGKRIAEIGKNWQYSTGLKEETVNVE